MKQSTKEHWNKIYSTKSLNEVGWFQPKPATSLEIIDILNIDKNSKIIDIGGGDSYLLDNLLELGYSDITVLDISKDAIERAKKRLGDKAKLVKWIISDICDFKPNEVYDLWHDRAAFHFLLDDESINTYKELVNNYTANNSNFIIGTFSESGPKKCSGIDIKQYTSETLSESFQENFICKKSFYTDHITPFDKAQNFVFCIFEKIKL